MGIFIISCCPSLIIVIQPGTPFSKIQKQTKTVRNVSEISKTFRWSDIKRFLQGRSHNFMYVSSMLMINAGFAGPDLVNILEVAEIISKVLQPVRTHQFAICES